MRGAIKPALYPYSVLDGTFQPVIRITCHFDPTARNEAKSRESIDSILRNDYLFFLKKPLAVSETLVYFAAIFQRFSESLNGASALWTIKTS